MVSMKCLIFPIIFRILAPSPIFADEDLEIQDYSEVTECVDHGFLCNPDLENPCCENFTICDFYDWPNQYYCLGNGTLQDFCKNDIDCNLVQNTICSENKCVCAENFAPLNATACGSLINGGCEVDEECVAENSHCVNKACACKPDFTFVTENECAQTYTGRFCNSDQDCFDVDRATCSDGHKCICRENSFARMDNDVCLSLIAGYCTKDSDCVPLNSICRNNDCICDYMYMPLSNRECKLFYLGKTCNKDEECIDSDRAMCSEDKKCVCKENHTPFEDSVCVSLVGGYCWRHEDCIPANTNCVGDRCACKAHFELRSNNHCVRMPLGEFCVINSDCITTSYVKCSQYNKCVCTASYVEENQTNCRPLLGGICLSDDDCLSDHSECFYGKCRCQKKFIAVSNDQCIPIEPPKLCYNKEDCNDRHANCNSDNKCECPALYEKRNGTCMPPLGHVCYQDDVCFPNHSKCVNSLCQCKDHFTAHSDNLCLPID
ncbi:hypothetical protein G9C98_005953 [Cotesia typhae]|uniref:Uncharacterized protein n=1 Tax=Cotesia typhae TaxID=2053667 RepID=A0A8J5URF8_9HYME|nr:hypothetical protein G9C98_005953 [Cotesia typhae]